MRQAQVALVRLKNFEEPAFERFLESNRPFSFRIGGAVLESGGEAPLWVDDPEAPVLCVHRARGWLAPLGSPEAVLAHLGDLEELAVEMEAAGENPSHRASATEESVLRLSAIPRDVRYAVASKRRIVRENGCGLYTLSREDFTPFREGPPIGLIREEEFGLVSGLAQYGELDEYVSERVARAPHAAVRIDGELAAYMIVHANGSIGMLHTMEKFRNRKLGRRVASALAEMQMERGMPVYCYIVDGNEASLRVFTSLGFRREADVAWIAFERKKGRLRSRPL